MIQNNKKGFNLHILLALGIFVIVVITMTAIQIEKASVKNRPLGSAQTAILNAAAHGDAALIYLDKASEAAAEKATIEFLKESGCQPDIESNTYACGSFAGICSWNDKENLCAPEFEKNLLFLFQSKLFPILSRNTQYTYPLFSLVAQPTEKNTTIIFAPQGEILSFSFQGGGTEGFTLQKKELFAPDYLNAKVTTQLNSLQRNGQAINHIVVHYTAGGSLSGAQRTLEQKGLSYHYIIDTTGTIYQFVPEERAAQHAGCSVNDIKCILPGMNSQSIGISFVNCGYLESCGGRSTSCYSGSTINNKCWQDYSEKQLTSFTNLVTDIVSRNPSLQEEGRMKTDTLVMHSDITKRKEDPGPAFTNRQTELEQKINEQLINSEISIAVSNKEATTPPTSEAGKGYTGTKLTNTAQEQVESYTSIINIYAKKYDVDPAIIKAIITHESRGIADISNKWNALGLMQIVPFSASSGRLINHNTCVQECRFTPANSMEEVKKEEYFDPDRNICCGTYLFKKMTQMQPIDWNCCGSIIDPGLCINKRYELPYEIGARRYNGMGCKEGSAADPDYVESIMGLYTFYGGNPAQFRSTEQGTYYATYELPVGLKEEVNINLKPLKELEETVEQIISSCGDNTKNCLKKQLEEYNNNHQESQLSQECAETMLAIEFLQKIKSCQEFPDDIPCVFTLENTHIPTSFKIAITPEEITQEFFNLGLLTGETFIEETSIATSGIQITNYLEEVSKNIDRFTVTFRNSSITNNALTNIFLSGYPVYKFEKKLKDHYYAFINKDKVFHYYKDIQIKKEEGYFEPIQKDYVLCFDNNKQQMNFSLYLEDKRPPAITTINYKYNATYGRYEIQWSPLLDYEDGTPIPDIAAYKIYCSEERIPSTNLPEELLSLTITPKNNYFNPADYETIPAMTGILDQCQGKSIALQPVNIVIVAEDAAGQIAFTYKNTPLSHLQVGNLENPLVHNQYEQEIHNPKSNFPLQSLPTGGLNLFSLPIPLIS